jgi:hypothetical protein
MCSKRLPHIATTYSLTVIIPFKSTKASAFDELCARWRPLAYLCEIIVCDGSAEPVHSSHAATAPPWMRLVSVDRGEFRHANDKVNGVCTGIREADTERILICDDDCVINQADISTLSYMPMPVPVQRLRMRPRTMCLGEAVETARSWVAEVLRPGGDTSPIYFGWRSTLWWAMKRIDGDCLFDDYMMFTVLRARFGAIPYHPVIVVHRAPARLLQWCGQQIRYAYEDLHAVLKTILFLAWPVLLTVLATREKVLPLTFAIVVPAAGLIALAWVGRLQSGPIQPAWPALLAPLWLVVRAVTTPVALILLITGGCPYGGRRIRRPATVRLIGW